MKRFGVFAAVVVVAPLLIHYPTLETQILTFGLLTVAFYLLLGELGFLSFGQATFNGIGAYVTARALIDGHAPLLVALFGGIVAGALGAVLIGALAIRGRGVYGVMLTFAFNEMAYYIAFEWRGMTGGDNGLGGLPHPALFGFSLDDPVRYYYFTAALVLAAFAAVLRLIGSPFGAVVRAIRENEERARAIGFRVARYKIATFGVSGALCGLAGGLAAGIFHFVALQTIGIETSTNVVIAAILGGAGSPYGALLGAAVYIVLSDSLSHVWAHWPLLFGVAFCAVVLFVRGGLWSVVQRWNVRAAHA
ncbi:MAG: branched-chain amino acid ABC transporter permease [Candidatus Velthaea sp.]